MSEATSVDVLIVTALKEELDALLAFEDLQWTCDAGAEHYTATLDGNPRPIRVAAAHATKMGLTKAAGLTTALVTKLRPKTVAMCGVCAGQPGDTELGDVIIADRVFVHDEGKLEPNQFRPDVWTHQMPESWLRAAQGLSGPAMGLWGYGQANEETATWWLLGQLLEGRRPSSSPVFSRYFPPERKSTALQRLRNELAYVSIREGQWELEPKGRQALEEYRLVHEVPAVMLPYHVHVGPIGSGSYVVKDPSVWRRVATLGERKILGLEMEAAAIGQVAHDNGLNFAVVKGVIDHADEHKSDRCKGFAARAAADVLLTLLRRTVERGEVRERAEKDKGIVELEHEHERHVVAGEDPATVREQLHERQRQVRRVERDGPLLHEHDVLANRYRLLEVGGAGGFAIVWKAFDRISQQEVAIKVLHGQWSQDRSRLARFVSGARQMQRLHHEAVVEMLEPPQQEGHHHFFVMPWLAGGDLERAVKSKNIGKEAGLRAVVRALGGLAHAHEQGVIHRDVKPANILLDAHGRGCICDFDLARAKDSTQGTRTGALGTFAYAAPEQLRDAREVDARADIYAAGMCALFVLAGGEPPVLVSRVEPGWIDRLDCGIRLRAALRHAVSYEAQQRTITCGELATAILRELEEPTKRLALLLVDDRQLGIVGEPFTLEIDEVEKPATIVPPRWRHPTVQTNSGADDIGRWLDISIDQVVQRMRWIETGNFVMGSPPNEPDRVENEGPQHVVTLTESFWLADTPCTQALWKAIMGANPSRFASGLRPVERVSWKDVQTFLARLSDLLPLLRIALPTEAQWEYACRAGTTGATYAGLHDIAWYSGNSQLGWELGRDIDSSGWLAQQVEPNRAGTWEVGKKHPNAWGLYDMLGNVWEWCMDGKRDYDPTPVTDPRGPLGPERVCRGSSWVAAAHYARAAYRRGLPPTIEMQDIGFRIASLEVGE